MKKKIDTLNNTLKKCEFDKTKLESMFPRKQAPKKQPSHVSQTHHIPHAHNT